MKIANVIATIGCVAVGGCAMQPAHYADNRPTSMKVETFDMAKGQCITTAKTATELQRNVFIAVSDQNDIIVSCMAGKGWTYTVDPPPSGA